MFPSYEQAIAPLQEQIIEVEHKRVHFYNSVKHMLLTGGGVALVALLLFFSSYEIKGTFIMIMVAGYTLFVLIYGLIARKRFTDYAHSFKHYIVRGLSEQLLEQHELPAGVDQANYKYYCSYEPNLRVSNSFIFNSQLFTSRLDRIDGCDLFHGRIGLTDFQFSELSMHRIETHTNAKGQTTTRRVQVFKGIFFVADFHKHFEGVTTLHSIGQFPFLNRRLSKIVNFFSFGNRRKKIKLENAAFNKAFNVQTTDEYKARYILTSTMMERLLAFKEKTPGKVDVSFVNSLMCVAISAQQSYFKPQVTKKIAPEQSKFIYDNLTDLFRMVEDFDLNTRIWSKE